MDIDEKKEQKSFLKRISTLQGRASLHEYWSFQNICSLVRFAYLLIVFIVLLIMFQKNAAYINIGDIDINRCINGVVTGIVSLLVYLILDIVLLVVAIGVSVRRCHDINKKGSWVILRFVPVIGQLIFFIMMWKKGENKENRFGECVIGINAGSRRMAWFNILLEILVVGLVGLIVFYTLLFYYLWFVLASMYAFREVFVEFFAQMFSAAAQ